MLDSQMADSIYLLKLSYIHMCKLLDDGYMHDVAYLAQHLEHAQLVNIVLNMLGTVGWSIVLFSCTCALHLSST